MLAGGKPCTHRFDDVERGPATLPGVVDDLANAGNLSACATQVCRGVQTPRQASLSTWRR
jgi:hypothetical protein